MKIKEVDFPYNVNFVSQKAFEAHKKLYSGYVDKVNEALNVLSDGAERDKANKNYSFYRGIKKDFSHNMNGVILHELFFRNFSRDNQKPGECFAKLAKECYGSLDAWEKDFIATAKAARGWAIAAFEQRTESLQNVLLDTHDTGLVANMYPLLVLDVYEHAFTPDYGANQDVYVTNALRYVFWDAVERRAKSLEDE